MVIRVVYMVSLISNDNARIGDVVVFFHFLGEGGRSSDGDK